MATGDLGRALQKAQDLERAGKLKEAYQAYLRAGAVQDAARILSAAGKSGDAGQLILGVLKIDPGQVNRLSASKRKLAYLAATYFAKDEESANIAVELFFALGHPDKAAETLEKAGDMVGAERIRASRASFGAPGRGSLGGMSRSAVPASAVSGSAMNRHAAARLERDGKLELATKAYVQLKLYGEAGRILASQKKTAEAAHMYAEGAMPFEAADCYLKVGDTGRGLENLVRVQKGDPRYRIAVVEAARVAGELGVLNFQFEHFVAEFVDSVPRDAKEMEAFYRIGELYERHNLLSNAKEAFAKIQELDPSFRDVSKKMERLDRYTQESSAVYERIREQESAFQGDRVRSIPEARPDGETGLPPLPEMPELPPMPEIPMNSDAPVGGTGGTRGTGGTGGAGGTGDPGVAQSATIAMRGEAPEQEMGFVIGSTIENRYRLDRELGRGGMAVVFAAHDLELEEDVALKVFLQQVIDPAMQEQSLKRFKQELKLSRQLTHPNIIRLYDIGLHGGYRYISMELLHGSVLEDLMGEPMEPAKGLAYMVQACAGLQAVHDKGVVHRDIKPDNIFVTDDETVKIMDFGIAKSAMGRGLTVEGMTAGTPEYIAPEQISAFSEVTHAADQYALGAIAFRMFTGQLLFEHEELTPLLMMHLNRPPTPPREVNPNIPAELEQIILRLLAKKPDQRFSSCRELAGHLQQLRVSFRR